MDSVDAAVDTGADQVCDFHRGFSALNEEHSGWIADIRGAIPPDLRGTFFRNGPGSMEVGGQRYGHWFDGPGMISAVTFVDGRAHFRNRYVRTPKYLKEKETGKISYRGFGTQLEGGWSRNLFRSMANPANTSISWHAGKLCAFYEGAQPYRLNPGNLETEGLEFYDGILNPRKMISAHGKINNRTGHQVNFGVNIAGLGLNGLKFALDVHDFDPRGRVRASCRVDLAEFPFLHDFGLTENYAIFLISSITFDLAGPLIGFRAMSDALSYDAGQAVRGIIVDLREMKVARQFELPPGIIVHFGNSHESGDEIVADYFHSDDTTGFSSVRDVFAMERAVGGSLRCCRINMKTGASRDEAYSHAPTGEFPAWDTRDTGYRSRYSYYVTELENGTQWFFNAVVKLDTGTGAFQAVDYGRDRYTSEALFVRKDRAVSEDDGYLLSFVYDAGRHATEVVILDAANLDNEIAAVKLSHHVPFGFHGHFTTDIFLG